MSNTETANDGVTHYVTDPGLAGRVNDANYIPDETTEETETVVEFDTTQDTRSATDPNVPQTDPATAPPYPGTPGIFPSGNYQQR
jgi:hypothetical protein